MDDIKTRWGATLPLLVTTDEEESDTVTITISQDSSLKLTKTVSFDSQEADLTISSNDMKTLDVGIYEYMLTIVNDDGTVEKYPDTVGCSDCELPTLEVCEANDNPEVS